ncbi:MAG TPA: sugar ABC transporter permease [Chloroflexota bacterium]|nr:sugar ABC transporter permease [Chloroflexota bacterium]
MTPRRRRRLTQAAEGYLFISPWILGFLFFSGGPVVASFVLSFFTWRMIEPPQWVGTSNYLSMFGQDPLFTKSLRVTLTYVAVAVPLHVLFALALAVLLNQRVRLVAFWRTIYYMPSVASGVAVAVLWTWLLNPEYGLVNESLGFFGVRGPAWLSSEQYALPALIVMSMWGVGGGMVIFLAGLQGIPQELIEAAELDGAEGVRRFWYVTLPLLSPVTFFNLILGVIAGFQTFTQAYVMTQGGPVNATLFYALYLYQNAFGFLRMGYAAAMAWFLFLVIAAITLLQFRLARRWVYYEGGGWVR